MPDEWLGCMCFNLACPGQSAEETQRRLRALVKSTPVSWTPMRITVTTLYSTGILLGVTGQWVTLGVTGQRVTGQWV